MWTYTGAPSSSNLDAVRLLSGQNSSGDPELVSDEEIAWFLTEEPSVYSAAASVCDSLANRYTTKATNRRVGELSLSYAERGVEFAARAQSLRARGSLRNVMPYAGGISVSDKVTQEQDTDRPMTVFTKGQDDNPAAGDQSRTWCSS